MALFRWGITLASVTPLADDPRKLFSRVSQIASAVDSSAFEALFVPDHAWQMAIGGGRTAPMLEAFSLLGALAATTRRVQLGAFVSPVTFRAPSLLAKSVTTLDVISDGRAVLGIGAGVNAEEHHAYGLDFPSIGERADRLGDALAICRAMFDEESASFGGAHHRIESATSMPRPVQSHLPILVGGDGERRTLPLVARFADVWNAPPRELDVLRGKIDVLRRVCDEAGRDIAGITKTGFVLPPADADALVRTTAGLLEAGLDGIVVAASHPSVGSVEEWSQALTAEFGSR